MDYSELLTYGTEKEAFVKATMELTQNCNFGCKHCYCAEKKSRALPINKVKMIIKKMRNAGIIDITFTGGEVLSRKDFLDIYMYAKNLGLFVTVFTNASLIDDEIIKVFKKYNPLCVSITLYGTNEEEYEKFTGKRENFSKVMENIDKLYKNNIVFQLKTVATKSSFKSLLSGEYKKITDKYGIALNYDPNIFPQHDGDKTPLEQRLTAKEVVSLDSLEQSRVDQWRERINSNDDFYFRCGGGVTNISIDYKGNASICGLYRGESISLIDNDIETVMSHLFKVHEKLLEYAKKSSCNSCKHRKICKWCPVYASLETGTYTEKIEYFCDLAKARCKEFC